MKRRRGTSVLERSLAYDRAHERAAFRLVTTRDVGKELSILKAPFGSPARRGAALSSLTQQITRYLPDVRSPNGHDVQYWLENTVWEIRHSEVAVRADNVLTLTSAVHHDGDFLAPDQCHDLYDRLVGIAFNAALAKWALNPDAKRIRRGDFAATVRKLVFDATHPASRRNKLRTKLEAAHLTQSLIEGAQRSRQAYRAERLRPKYVTTSAAELIDLDVDAVLQRLRAELEAGTQSDGSSFHSRCVDDLDALRAELSGPRVPRFYLQGCMYDMTDRCLHRFTRDPQE